jgi:hypothetical protein
MFALKLPLRCLWFIRNVQLPFAAPVAAPGSAIIPVYGYFTFVRLPIKAIQIERLTRGVIPTRYWDFPSGLPKPFIGVLLTALIP